MTAVAESLCIRRRPMVVADYEENKRKLAASPNPHSLP